MINKLVKVYLVLDIFVLILTFIFGLKWLLSSQIAFICTVFIAFVSYRSYSNLISSEIMSGRFDDIDFEKLDQEGGKLPKASKIGAFKAFMSPFKILAYLLLGVGFYLLAKFQLLNIIAFILGVSLIPVGTMLGVVLSKD
ncbi:MAG: hypothetical protein GXZ15_04320 [Campylobacter sp.]|nr:hypothetical protein [Campylobacter sp.]